MAGERGAQEHTREKVRSKIRQPRRQEPPAPLPPMCTAVVAREDAPGFEFCPSDEILVVYYLRRYVARQPLPRNIVVPADVYGTEPWNLLRHGRKEGFFFARRTRRTENSKWPSRTAGTGSWQSFKNEEEVKSAVDGHGEITVGIKNSLSYKRGSQKYSGWVMYEFELFDEDNFQELVLCHVKETRAVGKRNRMQDQEHYLTWSDDAYGEVHRCAAGAFEGDVAAPDSVLMTPDLKKRRRSHDDQTSSECTTSMPSSATAAIAAACVSSSMGSSSVPELSSFSVLPQAGADHRVPFSYQEQGSSIAPCHLACSSAAAATVTTTTAVIAPPPQEQILATSCSSVETMSAPSVGGEGDAYTLDIDDIFVDVDLCAPTMSTLLLGSDDNAFGHEVQALEAAAHSEIDRSKEHIEVHEAEEIWSCPSSSSDVSKQVQLQQPLLNEQQQQQLPPHSTAVSALSCSNIEAEQALFETQLPETAIFSHHLDQDAYYLQQPLTDELAQAAQQEPSNSALAAWSFPDYYFQQLLENDVVVDDDAGYDILSLWE